MPTQAAAGRRAAAAEQERRPLRRDAEENRRRLLEAATAVFAESGFEATMDDVAARAGVGVGTAYRRFANKEELIGALFRDRVAELIEVVDRALAEQDPWRGVVLYVEESVALQAGDRGLKELMLSSPLSREYVAGARDQLKPRIDELVERAHGGGCLRPGIEATDLVMVQLMLSELSDGQLEREDPPWRRFLPLVIDGLKAERTEPLPGRALSIDELDELLHGEGRRRAVPRSRS